MSKNGVGSRDMEKHVGDRPALNEIESLEIEELVRPGRHADVAVLGAFKRAARNSLQIVDCAANSRTQLFDGFLIVLEARRLDRCQARYAILRQVAGDLHLAR